MKNKDLRDFLAVLREAGPEYYVEAKRPLSPELEVCVLQEKLARQKRFPVIYCPEIEGSKIPLVTDIFGSYENMGLAMGMDPRSLTRLDILHEYRRRLADRRPTQMIPAAQAPVKEVILRGEQADLGLLPIVHHAVLNAGKYIPIGCMTCKDPDTGIPNVGVYRHQVKGKDKLGAMINPVNHGAYIARRRAELGKPMEVAIFIGHHPAVIMAAVAKGELGMNELEVAGGFLGEPLLVTQAETVDLPVPAYAEIAIEGIIDPRSMVTDGPFSEFAGYYGQANKPCYLIQVTAITMRHDAIYHDLDPSHREHNLAMVLPAEAQIYDFVKKVIPTVKAVHMPVSGTARFHVYISIKKRVAGEAKLAAIAAIAARPLVKLVIVVDEDIDVYDEEQVLWAVATQVQGDQDISMIPGVTGSHLDPTSYGENRLNRGTMTTHVIVDATKPVSLPFEKRIIPPQDVWQRMKVEDYLK